MASSKDKSPAPRPADPLELAKVVKPSVDAAPSSGPDASAAASAAGAEPAAGDGGAAELSEAELERLTAPTPPAPPAPPRPAKRVLKDKQVSLGGQMVIMKAGRVLTPEMEHRHHAALVEQGVEFEDVTPE